MYWFNLALDVTVPICGNASQRYHGPAAMTVRENISNSVDYIYSKIWADNEGRNRAGMVLVQDQRIFAAREVMKSTPARADTWSPAVAAASSAASTAAAWAIPCCAMSR